MVIFPEFTTNILCFDVEWLLLLFDNIKNLFDSNFFTAFFGAAGGAASLIIIAWNDRQRRCLAELNMNIAILSDLQNTILNTKKQHILPLGRSYRENCKSYKGANNADVQILKIYMKHHAIPRLDSKLGFEHIYPCVPKIAQAVSLVRQTERSVAEVSQTLHAWNKIVEHMVTVPNEDRPSLLFAEETGHGDVNTTIPDVISNLEFSADSALCFLGKSIKIMEKIGNENLPFWLKGQIAKSEITNDEYLKLLPSENFIDGWHY